MEGKGSDVGPGMASEFPFLPLGLEAAACAVAGIFDDERSMAPRDSRNLGHIARLPGIVHGNDSFGIGFPTSIQSGGVEVARGWFDIAKVRNGTDIGGGIGGSDKCDGRSDNPIAGTDPEHPHGEMQGCGGIANGYSVLGSDKCGEFFLKRLDLGSTSKKIRAKRANNGRNVVLGNRLFAVGDHEKREKKMLKN